MTGASQTARAPARAPSALFVLYDATCGVCGRCRRWLTGQAKLVPLHFLPLQTPELEGMFPGVGAFDPEREIVVVSDAGDVWQGARAWLMCLWALHEYRAWAMRLATPALLPVVGRFCALISRKRHRISALLRLRSDAQLRRVFGRAEDPSCSARSCRV